MAKGLRCAVQPVPVPGVASCALGMVLRTRCFVKGQVRLGIVLLAVQALAPAWVPASIPRPLSPLEQEVVSAIGTDDQVLRAVVSSDVVDVVNLFLAFQEPTQRTFGYEDVLVDVPGAIGVRVSGGTFQNISVTFEVDASLPVRVVPKMHSGAMASGNHQRLSLPLDSSATGVTPLRDRCWLTATALTKTRRINQSRAPKVCAESTTNLTLFRRLS